MSVALQKAEAAFPFGNTVKSVLGNKTRRDSIRTAIQLILTTKKGTIVYNPNFGSHVPELVFDNIEPATINLLRYYIADALAEQEPRIEITSLTISVQKIRKIVVVIEYIDRSEERQTQKLTLAFGK